MAKAVRAVLQLKPRPPAGARRLVVIGASGVLGRAVMQAAAAQGRAAIGTAFRRPAEGLRRFDIERDDIGSAVPELAPGDAVVLLAARSDPAWVFDNPGESHAVHVEGTLRVARLALRIGARVILVSSELVFDGVRGGYAEEDPTAPTTLFGRQRVEAEETLRASTGSWAVVRTGANVPWEKDPACPVFQAYRTMLARGARMAEDHRFTLTDARDTAAAVLQLADRDDCGVWHVASAPAASRTDLAGWILEASRHRGQMQFERIRFAELPCSEPQPERSWIVNHKAVQNLQLTFTEPWQTVERKVALIDTWFDARQRRLSGPTPPAT
jgi:dTDP-4-dehydrorhamnose reductase